MDQTPGYPSLFKCRAFMILMIAYLSSRPLPGRACENGIEGNAYRLRCHAGGPGPEKPGAVDRTTEDIPDQIPAAESIRAGEVGKAMQDRRLQYYDTSKRIIVFGNSASQARAVAEEIALHAYTNSSFFAGTYQELKRAKVFSECKPSPSNLDGLGR